MARRGRPPIADNVKMLKGTFRKSRARPVIPDAPQYRLKPPDFFDDVARVEWRRLSRLGAVTGLSRSGMEMLCACWSRMAAAEGIIAAAEGMLVEHRVVSTGEIKYRAHPAIKIADDAAGQLLNIARMFGMTPESRAQLGLARAEAGRRRPATWGSGD